MTIFLNTVLQSLERQFPSKQALDRRQTAEAIGIGLSTLDLRTKMVEICQDT